MSKEVQLLSQIPPQAESSPAPARQALTDETKIRELAEQFFTDDAPGNFDYLGFARALLALDDGKRVPEGWKLVPRRATIKMQDAFMGTEKISKSYIRFMDNPLDPSMLAVGTSTIKSTFQDRYRAMLAAAPSAEAKQDGGKTE